MTPANAAGLGELRAFRLALGIPEESHCFRPLARRGYSREGLDLELPSLVPDLTVSLDGAFGHPLSTDPDTQVSKQIFPLASVVERVQCQLA